MEKNRKRTSNWGETVCLIANKPSRAQASGKIPDTRPGVWYFCLSRGLIWLSLCVSFSKHRYYIYRETERGGEREGERERGRERERRGHKILGGALSGCKAGAQGTSGAADSEKGKWLESCECFSVQVSKNDLSNVLLPISTRLSAVNTVFMYSQR
jgi:hypothetical protein